MDTAEKEAFIKKQALGNLSLDENKNFKKLKAEDIEFATLVQQYEDLQKAIIANEHDDLKSRFKVIDKKNEAFILKKWLVAVAVIIMASLGSYYFYNAAENQESLYANYFEPYPNALQPVTRDNVEINQLTEAVLAYENQDYNTALKNFNLLLEKDDNDDITFYKAMTLLNLEETNGALKNLIRLKTSDTRFMPQVYWYTALIYLKDNNTINAVNNLNALKKLKTPYKKNELEDLLKKITN